MPGDISKKIYGTAQGSKIFLVIILVYFFCSDHNLNAMQLSFISLTASLAEKGGIIVDDFIINTADLSFNNGHFYSGMAPGISFLSLPYYLLCKMFLKNAPNYSGIGPLIFTGAITSFIVAFSMVFLYLLLKDMGSKEKEAGSLTFLCALGTLFLVYGSTLDSRAIASSLSVIVYYLVYHNRNVLNEKSCVLSGTIGFLLGIIPSFNYASLLLIPVFLLYFVYSIFKRKDICASKKMERAAVFIAGLSIPLSLLMFYNYAAFGDPFSTPYHFRYGLMQHGAHSEGIAGFTYPKAKTLLHLLFLPYRGGCCSICLYFLSAGSYMASAGKK